MMPCFSPPPGSMRSQSSPATSATSICCNNWINQVGYFFIACRSGCRRKKEHKCSLFFSVLPRPKFLFFCANLGHCPDARKQRQIQNFRVLSFLLVRWSLKQRHRALEETEGAGWPKQIHLSFGFLRVSVPPWCKGLAFSL